MRIQHALLPLAAAMILAGCGTDRTGTSDHKDTPPLDRNFQGRLRTDNITTKDALLASGSKS